MLTKETIAKAEQYKDKQSYYTELIGAGKDITILLGEKTEVAAPIGNRAGDDYINILVTSEFEGKDGKQEGQTLFYYNIEKGEFYLSLPNLNPKEDTHSEFSMEYMASLTSLWRLFKTQKPSIVSALEKSVPFLEATKEMTRISNSVRWGFGRLKILHDMFGDIENEKELDVVMKQLHNTPLKDWPRDLITYGEKSEKVKVVRKLVTDHVQDIKDIEIFENTRTA